MSVPTPASSNVFSPGGATTVFSTGFYFLAASELVVTKTVAGVAVVQTLGVHYSVTMPAGVGLAGSVVMLVAPPAGSTLLIERTVPITQPTSFRLQGQFNPAIHEDQFDEVVFIAQQLARRVSALESAGAVGSVVAGNGLAFAGTVLNVGAGAGIQSNADDVAVIYGTNGDIALVNAAAAGSSGILAKAARADHQHGSTVAAPGAVTAGAAAAVGASTSLARADHIHSVAVGAPVAVDAAAAVTGASGAFADGAHKHQVSTAAPVGIIDGASAAGTANTLARSDHQHTHGALLGGTNHAVVGATAGFMSAADKVLLDALTATRSHVAASRSVAQAIPHNAPTTVVFDNELRDSLGEYNPATGIFTAQKDGWYLIASSVWLDGNAADVAATNVCYIALNGGSEIHSVKGSWDNGVDSSIMTAHGSAVAFMTAGQTAFVQVFHFRSTAAARNTSAAAVVWLTIDRIG